MQLNLKANRYLSIWPQTKCEAEAAEPRHNDEHGGLVGPILLDCSPTPSLETNLNHQKKAKCLPSLDIICEENSLLQSTITSPTMGQGPIEETKKKNTNVNADPGGDPDLNGVASIEDMHHWNLSDYTHITLSVKVSSVNSDYFLKNTPKPETLQTTKSKT